MKITVFTSNQPRHIALIKRLAAISTQTFAVLECNTVFPGAVADFIKKTEVMRQYFDNVMRAERYFYGDIGFLPNNVQTVSVKSGDLSQLSKDVLLEALSSDLYVVFGASYIRGWLVDFLVQKKAINIHMGVSPYYRGAACNFWALFDQKPEYVGATIHHLSKGLDNGEMLYHALPTLADEDPFLFSMKAVEAAQISLVGRIESGDLFRMNGVPQDKSVELRYTRNSDFTDEIVAEFFSLGLSNAALAEQLKESREYSLISPFYL